MLKRLSDIDRYYIACGKTDMRMGIEGLVSKVTGEFKLDPYESCAFFFCGNKSDRIKVLLWEGDGFLIMYKRFESGRLQWPRNNQEAKLITKLQIEWLLTGLQIEPKAPIKKVHIPKNRDEILATLL